jgi:hypothetical protein
MIKNSEMIYFIAGIMIGLLFISLPIVFSQIQQVAILWISALLIFTLSLGVVASSSFIRLTLLPLAGISIVLFLVKLNLINFNVLPNIYGLVFGIFFATAIASFLKER